MAENSALRAEHIENLRVGSLSVGGTTVVRQLLQCELPPKGETTKLSAILSTPLSLPGTKTPFQVPSNARIIGFTVLPLVDAPEITKTRNFSSICVGLIRATKDTSGTYGYKGSLSVPPDVTTAANGTDTYAVKAIKPTTDGKPPTLEFHAAKTVAIDLSSISGSLPLAEHEHKDVGSLHSNAYHSLYRFLSPTRCPSMAIANRTVGVTYEGADVLLKSKKPQYFEWNSSSDDENPYLQVHFSVWAYQRVGSTEIVYGGGSGDDYYMKNASKVEVKVELVYEIQAETLEARENALA
jgi:hypothetical protein